MLRRDFLSGLIALAALPKPALADGTGRALRLGEAQSFDPEQITEMARAMAAEPYEPLPDVPAEWTGLSYDQYRQIRFDTRNALWSGDDAVPLRLDVFPPGLYFPRPVRIHVIEGDSVRPLIPEMSVFSRSDSLPDLPEDPRLGFSGLRLRTRLDDGPHHNEFAVFQGASYFRAIGSGLTYGLSARGLAIDTAEPTGEEFPDFRDFWVEKPSEDASSFRVHALLDSPSCTGAYSFEITPGDALEMQVRATIFARQEMRHFGLGPLTSMFFFDETNRDRFSDFRPAVHDSDGLLMLNGAGEPLWRPLANPTHLQVSAFQDDDPQGFGLMQRARAFSDFADLEALYHRRPGLWVEPGEGWGRGAVTLVEIPTDREIYDNIVAYWRPAEPLAAGQERAFSYRLLWSAESDYAGKLEVLNTRMGARHGGGYIVTVDFADGAEMPEELDEIEPRVSSSAGRVEHPILQRNPETGGARLAFGFDSEGADLAEMRAELRLNNSLISEVWLYRWTR